MRKLESLQTNAGELVLKELTVSEIRSLMQATQDESTEMDLVGGLLSEKFTLSELSWMVQGDFDSGALTQSDIEALEGQLVKLNPRFFSMKDRVMGMARQLQEMSLSGS